MKRYLALLAIISILLPGCVAPVAEADIAATTLPVYQFAATLCQGTGLRIVRLISENVSCLHDYTLQVSQVKSVENAAVVVISGAGLEGFMEDLLHGKTVIDSSGNIPLAESCHSHEHGEDPHDHDHEHDPHIWLSPINAMAMAENICAGLSVLYPQHKDIFQHNLDYLLLQLQQLQRYAETQLADLSCRDIITFHDGFSYMAEAFDLHILAAVEEESGAEASARELIELIKLVNQNNLPAVFTEINGSDSAAGIISAETGKPIFTLNMAMAGEDYLSAMYHNINTLREALS
jgi:ABC-type Zn uptake system ZnuABC Zn-binding protein ZnuA